MNKELIICQFLTIPIADSLFNVQNGNYKIKAVLKRMKKLSFPQWKGLQSIIYCDNASYSSPIETFSGLKNIYIWSYDETGVNFVLVS